MSGVFEALGLSAGRVCVVGSGGKTSFIELCVAAARGLRPVAVAPSTKIVVPPSPALVDRLVLLDEDAPVPGRAPTLEGGVRVEAFGRAVEGGKLLGLAPRRLGALWRDSPGCLVLCEGDGSRGLPLKVPAPWEPVVPPGTELLVWVVGLAGLGRTVAAAVHRFERWRPDEGDRVVDEALVEELVAEGGYPAALPPDLPLVLLVTGAIPGLEGLVRRLGARVAERRPGSVRAWLAPPRGQDGPFRRP